MLKDILDTINKKQIEHIKNVKKQIMDGSSDNNN